MKTVISFFICCLSFSSCDLLISKVDEDTEQPYTAKIAWDSGLVTNSINSHTVYGNDLYFYERPPGERGVNIYNLTRLNADTGKLVWRSSIMFSDILICQPIVIGDYVYVFLEYNIIICFEKETGEHTATVRIKIRNKDVRLARNLTGDKHYIYLNAYNSDSTYFACLDANVINYGGSPEAIQDINPEIIWEPESNSIIKAKPVIANNIIYTSTETYGSQPLRQAELAGFDMDTWGMVFYKKFGGAEDGDIPFPEGGGPVNPIFIHGDILYYLNWSITAWNLKTEKQLFRYTFTWDTPKSRVYAANNLQQAVYYRGKIYYTSCNNYETADDRNIHCIDAKTGKQIWSTIAKDSATLDSNLIIAYDRLYVPQGSGFRVYAPETGKLIGVDKSFWGLETGRNVLYKDTMICIRVDPDTLDARLVAVDVGE